MTLISDDELEFGPEAWHVFPKNPDWYSYNYNARGGGKNNRGRVRRPASSTRDRVAERQEKMKIGLRSEFHRFSHNGILLKRLYSDTLKALDDIYSSGVIPRESWKGLEGKVKEIQKIRTSIGRPPSVIILGQNCRAKAILVNELLGQTQLPVEESTEALNWRMVRFKYSRGKSQVLLALGSSYEFVENLQDNHFTKTRNTGIRNVDLALPEKEATGPLEDNPVVEVHLEHPLLQSSVQMVVPPTGNMKNLHDVLHELFSTTTPIVLYGIAGDSISDEDTQHLQLINSLTENLPVFFIRMPTSEETSGLTEVDRNEVLNHGGFHFTPEGSHVKMDSSITSKSGNNITDQLEALGFVTQEGDRGLLGVEEELLLDVSQIRKEVSSRYIRCLNDLYILVQFVRTYLQSQLINAADKLHDIQNHCLQLFILSAFDMAREMQVTPKRIEYARLKESELYDNLLRIAEKKQDEMCNLIAETITERKEDILQKAERHQFNDPFLRNWEGPLSGKLVSQCMGEIRELVVLDLNNILAQKLINSVYCLHDTFLGTLERCISSLERNLNEIEDDSVLASVALKQILTAAYQINISNDRSSSFFKGLIEKLKRVAESLPWCTVDSVDAAWRRSVANDILKLNLVCQKQLAQTLCGQLKEKLKASHESFTIALRNLEMHHNDRLERTGEQGFRLRKIHAPRLARLALETSSIIDFLRFGMPSYGKEVGRGQYGVVYACEYWGPFRPCAVKSVVPMDDKHWNDLAMEFYYMKSIPEHDRIVRVRGSVIDHSYAGGIPAVLIIMDKLNRDLYCAIKVGLPWLTRLQVALDVVSGIRYLHSQGLVHRDIKLKNVLMDENNRAKLTDLGFCKPEAMMSGSIVGTPIHMAPELFSGQYDNSVDVYAFGILFWYLCAGTVKLPQTFEQCQNKELLWNSVRKGCRPERLKEFDEECWQLMESCWAGQPSQRPLLGLVEPVIQSIKLRYEQGRSVMHDRYSTRKKRTTRLLSWPNPSEDLKLENFPNHDSGTTPKVNIVSPPEDAIETNHHSSDKDVNHHEDTLIQETTNHGIIPGVAGTDIDRTVYENRDQLTVTNVFLEPSPSSNCLVAADDAEQFECVSPDEILPKNDEPIPGTSRRLSNIDNPISRRTSACDNPISRRTSTNSDNPISRRTSTNSENPISVTFFQGNR